MRNIYLLISQGNVFRDLVRLGTLNYLLETCPDIRVILLTQAYVVPEVLAELQNERVVVAKHDLFNPRRWMWYLMNLRCRSRHPATIQALLRLEKLLMKPNRELEDLFSRYPPQLVISSHPRLAWEWDVITLARKRNVPTLGIVKSWDNILSHLYTRADYVAVWGRTNFREAIQVERYHESRVRMTGAAPFDRYFEPSVIQPRESFWHSKGLDPSRPIIMFGTAGSFSSDWDETFMMDLLLELRRQCRELRDLQIVCRLHPITHLEYFWPYRQHPGVVLSFGSYIKTLGWCMTRDEVDEMANMLRHSDLVITPASTLSIEGPIFDTPTIVTLFSTVRPDLHARAVEQGWLTRHFRTIGEMDWLPLARTPDELREMMVHALNDRSWYRAGRQSLVDDVITLTDGKSYQRISRLIDELSRQWVS